MQTEIELTVPFSGLACSRCGKPVKGLVCPPHCGRAHCPYCGAGAGTEPGCSHLLAADQWYRGMMRPSQLEQGACTPDGRAKRWLVSPFVQAPPELPDRFDHCSQECRRAALGDLHPLLEAYAGGQAPPDEYRLFGACLELLGWHVVTLSSSRVYVAAMSEVLTRYYFVNWRDLAREEICRLLVGLAKGLEQLSGPS